MFYYTALVVISFIANVEGGLLGTSDGLVRINSLGDQLISFTDTATKYGYYSKEYKVRTKDGYILSLFNLRNSSCSQYDNTPVLLMHSILQSADVFVDAGPDAAIGFLLADDCLDVWAGTTVGNYYGRGHTTLDPDKDAAFWTPTTGYEMATRDLPAQIDFILFTTNSKNIYYVGHGEGGTIFYILNSEMPEYNAVFKATVNLAPSTRLKYSTNIFDQLITTSFNELQTALKLIGQNELFYRGSAAQFLYRTLCEIPLLTEAGVCESIFLLIDDFKKDLIADSTLVLLSNHEPSGTSLNNFDWYGQLFATGKFQTFDYGSPDINMKTYGSEVPREFDLTRVTARNVAVLAQNDTIVVREDLEWLVGQLPNATLVTVSDPKYNHFGLVYNKDTRDEVYPIIRTNLN